ncbi:unnamed protein product [Thlaspi arvense]|uniref:TFIIS central domain-containing protein n=1 Tax=Thlaspi arvense TaxID=13288 RepID=A0AAU9RNF5_THLAR|nr:unnamed protein product [Thlaspi arvense]
MGAEDVSNHLETFGESKLIEIGSSNDPPVPFSDMKEEPLASASSNLDFPKVETSVSGPMPFTFEPEGISFQSFQPSALADSQSLMTQLQPPDAHPYSLERSLAAACRSPRSFQLTGKRKAPPEPTLSGSAPNKRVEPVHHRPWLEQFSASILPAHMPAATLSPKTEHPPMPAKKVRQMEPASQKSGKQAMNKKQTGPSQGSTKTQNEGNESLRSKMKESLAAALALVQEHEESPKEKKNSETEEASVPVAESDESASAAKSDESATAAKSDESASAGAINGPVAEGMTRDESSGQKDGNGIILSQETSNDTKMNYVNQSDVQKTQFDEVFPCDDVRFSDSIFSSDELLQGNGLSWALEPVSDLGERKENESGGEKSFEDPDLLASKIELELFKLFGGVNKKYKEKGRSLLFNLKDKNNPELRESVMCGKISPERLCSMTAEELASKELSQWRQAKAEEMAEMVVLRDADVDVRSLVRKTHKGEFQVEIDPVDSVTVDVSAGITSSSKPRSKAKSTKSSTPAKSTLKKDDSNDKNTKSDQGMTMPSTEETDPMQGVSMDDEMKDVGFLPPIVSLDEFMESLNSEPPFGSPHGDPSVKEEPASEKNDSEVGSHSKSPSGSPKQSPKEPRESVSHKAELEKTNAASPKPDAGVKLDGDVSEPGTTHSVDSIKEDQKWDGILQLSVSSAVSVTGIFKRQVSLLKLTFISCLLVNGKYGKYILEHRKSKPMIELGF